ncbi:S-layer homology domain-containing protein [Paenibacillus sp. 19GGS1-52]|uniref:S-layer homology domain-containing protein n=1 Tax=Paenibacillus sp. 19GGS1-52 TaxID=2758563 RepID=UPI001EFA96D6|nr:S-layer homology domain-containing protein [Paenibacillus sp. 19GGS1-52]ULO05984.1 S-layer homology domain-containing protein [Paenibacillus sp. 19GGS1-52]
MFIKNWLLKKSILVMLIICLTSLPFGTIFAGTASDIEGNWAKAQINKWMDNGLISGYPDGQFKPNTFITRAELVALINKSFGFVETKESLYKDVTASDWYNSELLKANAAGYIQGYSDGSFGPNKKVTRQEFAVIISKLLQLTASEAVNPFSDTSASATWSKGAINSVSAKGIMNGYSDNTFHPQSFATRAEAIVILDRSLAIQSETTTVSYNKAGTYGPETGNAAVSQNVVVNSADVTLQNMTIAGNLLLAEGIAEGNVYLKNVTVTGITTVKGGGAHSVHFENTQLATVIIDKAIGSIRIVVEGSTQIDEIQVQSTANIESNEGASINTVTLSKELPKDSQVSLTGSFKAVNVLAQNIIVEIPQGSIQTLNIDKEASGNKLNNEAQIISFTINASMDISGKGKIETALINAPGITMEYPPAQVEVGKDVSADVSVNIGGVDKVAATVLPSPSPTPVISVGVASPVTGAPTAVPTAAPTPTAEPTPTPTAEPTPTPSAEPTAVTTLPTMPIEVPTLPTVPIEVPTLPSLPSPTPPLVPTFTPTVTPVVISPPIVDEKNVMGIIKNEDGSVFEDGTLGIFSTDSVFHVSTYSVEIKNGEFSLELPSGSYQLGTLHNSLSQEDIEFYYVFTIEDSQSSPSLLNITIPRKYEGTLTNEDGSSIEDGFLSVTGTVYGPNAHYSSPIVNGKFSLYLPDDTYTISDYINAATKKQIILNMLPTFKVDKGQTTPSELDFTLPKKYEGTIENADGIPFGDGWISMYSINSGPSYSYNIEVNNGKFNLYLPDGSYKINSLLLSADKSILMFDYSFTVLDGKSNPDALTITLP